MTRLLRLSVCALGIATVWTGTARAQVYGGVGVGLRPYGPYGGFGSYYPGAFGYFPGSYNGFWSNGLSQYGPPVRTYGTVPGVFGSGNQGLYAGGLPPNIQIHNGANIGLGTSGAGGAGPRRRHWYEGDAGMGANAPTMGVGTIEVRVPTANAEVLFEGINTRQTGTARKFQSPAIQPGPTYFYNVQARWKQDGKDVDQTRSVGIRANETVVVDFNQPQRVDDTKPLFGEGR